jgi:hypothetical protein
MVPVLNSLQWTAMWMFAAAATEAITLRVMKLHHAERDGYGNDWWN